MSPASFENLRTSGNLAFECIIRIGPRQSADNHAIFRTHYASQFGRWGSQLRLFRTAVTCV